MKQFSKHTCSQPKDGPFVNCCFSVQTLCLFVLGATVGGLCETTRCCSNHTPVIRCVNKFFSKVLSGCRSLSIYICAPPPPPSLSWRMLSVTKAPIFVRPGGQQPVAGSDLILTHAYDSVPASCRTEYTLCCRRQCAYVRVPNRRHKTLTIRPGFSDQSQSLLD